MRPARRKITFVFAIMLGLILLGLGIWNACERWRLQRFKAELTMKGEKLAVAELIPARVKDNENAALEVLGAASQLPTSTTDILHLLMISVKGEKAQVLWRMPELKDESSTNSWIGIEQELQTQQPILERLQAGLKLPKFNPGNRYDDPSGPQLPNYRFGEVHEIIRWLALEAIYELHAGQSEGALTNLMSLLRFVQLTEDEPEWGLQNERDAAAFVAQRVSWQCLQARGWHDEQLAALQKNWENLSFVGPWIRVLEMERAKVVAGCKEARVSPSKVADDLGIDIAPNYKNVREYVDYLWNNLSAIGQSRLWCWHWSYPDERNFLHERQASLDAGRRAIVHHSSQTMELELKQIHALNSGDSFIPRHFLLSKVVLTPDRLIFRSLVLESLRSSAVTAIALKRYELRHGRLPANLNGLVPEFLPSVPLDYGSGKPLLYQIRAEEDFMLRIENENPTVEKLSKENAKKKTPDANGSFVVWPQPM